MHYEIGPLRVLPDERCVRDGGTVLPLGARAFDLLLHLLEHRDRVVSKAELLDRVWLGRIVEEGNLPVQISALRKLFGPRVVATVAGHGYRFALSVRVFGAATILANPPDHPPLPDRPSLAVLPFVAVGEEPDGALFVDGLVEDLITECSRFEQIFVIARNSSFAYRGRQVDARTIGRELGVRYVVEGSVGLGPRRLRVHAALVDAVSGAQVWAERYDRDREDLFAVQEELTHSIVTALWPQLEESELGRARLTGAGSVDAYALALRARRLMRTAFLHGGNPALQQQAEALLAAAEAGDPEGGEVLRARAYLRWLELWSGSAAAPAQALADGLRATQRAIEQNPGDYLAVHRRALLKSLSGEDDVGLHDIRRAHALNPNDSGTLSMLAAYEAGHGAFDLGVRLAGDTLRLSPRDPLRLHFFNMLQIIHCYGARDDEALGWCERALSEAPEHAPSHYFRMLALAALDREVEAREALARLRALAPRFAALRLQAQGPRYSDGPTWARECALVAGLAAAA